MMDNKMIKYVNCYADRSDDLNKLIVTAFIRNNGLEVGGGLLSAYTITESDNLEDELDNLKSIASIEDVISIFESAISKKEQAVNGAVYTPKYIRDYIVQHVFTESPVSIDKCLCADISCGCGAFLYTVAQFIHQHTHQSYQDIVGHLYGVDICQTSINRAQILLSLAALTENGEELCEQMFHLYTSDSLTFDFMSLPAVSDNGGFDIIVGNPPYVRSKNIDVRTKANLYRWFTSKAGNPDLYIPFFEIGYTLLNECGRLGYITVNSFFKSINARALRKFFTENKVLLSIIDFGQQLVFKKKLAYTCLAFMSKENAISLNYVKGCIDEVKSQKKYDFYKIAYDSLESHRGWNLNEADILDNIRKIEQAGEPLGEKYVIKNGIATLANRIYIFRPTKSDNEFYYLNCDGKEFRIEKDICKNIIKPNIIKTEADIQIKEEKVIFPYDNTCNILPENVMKRDYPYTYKYLLTYKYVLDARDKGEGDYEEWYAFGRTQAITDSGRKLLFPYMSDLPHFIYTPQEDMMIYCGYAIYNDSESELLILKKILESSVFDYYIKNTSKPYSTGYYSYAKNYVKSFGIYPFNEEEKQQLLSLEDRKSIDVFVANRYRVVM